MVPARVGLRSSTREIAKKLRTSPGTVANRTRAMYASGLLLGSSVYFNPVLLGLHGGAYALEVSPTLPKPQVIGELKSIEGLLFIHNFHGNLIGIYFAYKDGNSLERKLELFRTTCLANNGIFSAIPFPPCTISPTASEWKLISRLSEKSYESYSQLATELNTSVRTLKRKISRIQDGGAILSSPRLNYTRIDVGVACDVIVIFSSPEKKPEAEKKITTLLTDCLLFGGPAEDYMVYNLVVPNLHTASELANLVRKIGGVRTTRIELVDEHIDLTEGLQTMIPRHFFED
jgi:DNA-binding Lrp family transcriptional regulator